ncbi:MAG: ribose-phosphate pyrophosphokinase [Verrucomicrobia bacterium]|nr:ribose-phosphate pyrophosphokinase [Verrucomicrobiota bacterium]
MQIVLIACAFLFSFIASSLEAEETRPYKLFAGNACKQLAEAVAKQLKIPLSHVKIDRFNDGEIKIKVEENVRNTEVFIIQSTCPTCSSSVNDNLMELFLLIRAMKRSSSGPINVIVPYFGYARQDRKTESRVPISASDIAMLLETAGADHVIAVDLHCGQIQGFFHKAPVDNLYSSPIFVRYFASKNDLVKPVVVSPDAGGVERAKKFLEGLQANKVSANLAIIVKQRAGAGVVDKMNLVGSVEGCDAIIVDDICDTGGTLVQAAKELKQQGARRVFACITHPVFSGPALERIAHSELTELVVTDSIAISNQAPPNIVQLSIASLLAQAIEGTHSGASISHLFAFHDN